MFLSVHTCAGAIVGRFIPNPFIAFLLGIISHFLMDLIPHGDRGVYDRYKKGKFVRRAFAIVLLDGIFSIYIVMLVLTVNNKVGSELNIAFGIVGATLPDALTVVYEITKTKFLKWVHKLHFKIHRLIAKEISYTFGVFYQLILLSYLLVYLQTF